MATLAQQASAFASQLGDIRAQHGSAWTVFLDGAVRGAFASFEEAADFAFAEFEDENFLIRHTYEQPEFVPFMLVES